ncbi:MAG TPA: helix-turn-helix transcriptional regulator [Thermoanaerobacterales bacterium]|nr:helix-turn-helix transcriptional regulator [Thermoanaerobacterales bacterium]
MFIDIGKRLKDARLKMNFTQEQVAERLSVSRQTISNWENEKTYPDIVRVIELSNLYSITLDELLKEDKKMIEYLEESTNVVKSKMKFSKLIQIMTYLVIWAGVVIVFWLGGGSDAMGYSIMSLYIVLPVSTLITSIFIGKDKGWSNKKWFLTIFFGVMYMLASYATFSLANMISFNKFNIPDVSMLLPGMIVSAIGMGIGSIIKYLHPRR